MSLGRRNVSAADPSAWIFNRMADVYDARPPYPEDLVAALSKLAGDPRSTIVDLGAGIGHLALPLAQKGHRVIAVEPARAMLAQLEQRARARGIELEPHHGTAETLVLPGVSAQLVLLADALHFLDRERTAAQIARVLDGRGALAVVTVTHAESPFMNALRAAMEAASPRRPRSVDDSVTQLARLCGVRLGPAHRFLDETPMDAHQLERMLRSISFIGPALNQARWAAFLERIEALPGPRTWARVLTLHAGRRS